VLSELVVHNFAIIRHLDVSFQPGLNILSGETGAGKSILVGAVNLILGSRASQEMIRTGTNEATVEAVFLLSDRAGLRERLHEWGLEATDEILIRRTISRSGRNRVHVNHQLLTLQQLQQLAKGLISVSGQHEHQLLLDSEIHLGLLDAFGNLESASEAVGKIYAGWSKTWEELHKLRKFKQDQASQMDWMRFQLQELESAKLEPNEDKELEQERNLLKHAATIRDAAQGAHQIIYAGRGAMLEQLAAVEKNVETLQSIDPSQAPLTNHLEQVRIHLEELSHSLQQYAHKISFDPQRMSAVEERLAVLQKLGKKYGGTVEAMLQRLEELKKSLSLEEDVEFQEEQLEKELEKLSREYLQEAKELSRRRREAALRLSEEVEKTLAALDMPKARFAVGFYEEDSSQKDSKPPFTPTGIDRVEFLLSANPGEDLKPLVRVASGGELSRILLALKSLLSRRGEAETLIFDEVDTGIGGRTAELVGLQLERLAARHQVICITHLPQIACYGEHHYKVMKQTVDDETVTDIRLLSPEDRIEELARMLGGIAISEKTRAHAEELRQRARESR
jgi:DNA repair protein RecN (Recombination protein N)